MLQYLMWRIMVGLHNKITLSFLVVSHTKFSPDWCFGLIKHQFRQTSVSCPADITTVVDQSATVNTLQLVGTQEGEILVPTYNWAGMLGPYFRKLKNIKAYHHFQFVASTPGVLQLHLTADGQEQREMLLKPAVWSPDTSVLPDQILPNEVYRLRDSGTYTTTLESIAQKRCAIWCARNCYSHLQRGESGRKGNKLTS